MKMTDDEKYMRAAIREAKKAYALGEVMPFCKTSHTLSAFFCT